MSLDIVIPTKNEEKYLPQLLTSIKEQTLQPDKIIVADANSTDRTREISKKYGALVVSGGLPPEGRNNGAKYSESKRIAFIDSDIILPHKSFLEEAISTIEKRELDIAGTLQTPIPAEKKEGRFFDNFFYETCNALMWGAQFTKIPKMQCCMFADREAYSNLEGFADLEFGEDSDLAKRAKEKGYKFGILAKPGKVLVSPRRLEGQRMKMFLKYLSLNTRILLGKKFPVGKANYFK